MCVSSDVHQSANQKRGTLSMQFPHKSEGKELKILVQPETQHRARYLTEGSRGSVKDRSQQGFPTVKVKVDPFKPPCVVKITGASHLMYGTRGENSITGYVLFNGKNFLVFSPTAGGSD